MTFCCCCFFGISCQSKNIIGVAKEKGDDCNEKRPPKMYSRHFSLFCQMPYSHAAYSEKCTKLSPSFLLKWTEPVYSLEEMLQYDDVFFFFALFVAICIPSSVFDIPAVIVIMLLAYIFWRIVNITSNCLRTE